MKKKILIAPLDWGLGHATRCIPIIRILLEKGQNVCIATSGLAHPLLAKEFPQLEFFQLPSYKAAYSSRWPLMLKVFIQAPYFLSVIWKEHMVVEQLVKKNRIDVVMSDNRYGCYSKSVKSIFITHQVNILLPKGLYWLQGLVNFCNHRLIQNFDECWVPDFETNSITGALTKSGKLPTFFMGMLSRFQKSKHTISIKYNLLVLLSGPEPQRSIFEALVFQQLKMFDGNFLVVRGLPGVKEQGRENSVNHLLSDQLQQAIESSEIVLSRSGYTTVMDLYFLEKRAIFVPTPGQPEQEYLAQQLQERGINFSMSQQDFDLVYALRAARKYEGFRIAEQNKLEEHIFNWLSRL